MRSSPSMSMSSYLWSLADIAWSVSLAWEYSEGRTHACEELQRAAAGDVQLLEQAAIAEDMPQGPQEAEQEDIPDAMRPSLAGDTQDELQHQRAPPSARAVSEPEVMAAEEEIEDEEEIENEEMDEEMKEATMSRTEEAVEAEEDEDEAEEEEKTGEEEKDAEEEEAEEDEASNSREASEPELGSLPLQQEEAAETAPSVLERGNELEAARMELREEREKTRRLQQQLEYLQGDLICTRLLCLKALAERQEKEDQVKRLELECHSMIHLANVPGPWKNFTIRPGTGGYYEDKCLKEVIVLKAHHKENGRVYEDKDVSEAVKAMILFRMYLQQWTAENESAQEEELEKAARARAGIEARLERAEQESRRNPELQEEAVNLSRRLAALKSDTARNDIELKYLREEHPLQAAQIKELKNEVLQLQEQNSNLSGIDDYCDEVEDKWRNLDVENDQLRDAKRKAKARLAESREELAEARKELEAAKGQGAAAEKELAEVCEQLEGAEDEIVLLKRLNDTLMGERDEARSAVANQRLQEQPEESQSPYFCRGSPMRQSPSVRRPQHQQPCNGRTRGPHDDLMRTSLTELYYGK